MLTAEEHKLLVLMFGLQQQRINLLIEILKSKGIMEADDLKAFEFAIRADVPANESLALEVATLWANLCEKRGFFGRRFHKAIVQKINKLFHF